MEEKLMSIFRNKVFRAIGIILGIYVLLKYIVPLIIPFLIAAYIAYLLLPLVDFINRKTNINKGLIASFFALLIGSVLAFFMWLLLLRGVNFLKEFLCNLDIYKDQFFLIIKDCSGCIEKRIGIKDKSIESAILNSANAFVNNLQITYLPMIMDHSFYYLKNIARVIGTVVITVIAAVFIVKDYEVIVKNLKKNEKCRKLLRIVIKIIHIIEIFLKAQIIILAVVGVICIIGLFLTKTKNAIGIGLVIGLLDTLPFIGTSIVLIPWAIIEFIRGNYYISVILIITYLVTALARELLEPKLMSKKMGVLPIAMIMAIYLGIKLFGLVGVLLGPVGLLMIIELCKDEKLDES
ncbi:MAG: AI-2E family transporter [Lachnospiraceae bacterium]|nr:AI-2E family transporter [Lachnospiraceae bacterium]